MSHPLRKIVEVMPLADFRAKVRFDDDVTKIVDLEPFLHGPISVSYTHLDVYKRQVHGVVNISYPVLNQHGEAIAAMTVPFLCLLYTSRCV